MPSPTRNLNQILSRILINQLKYVLQLLHVKLHDRLFLDNIENESLKYVYASDNSYMFFILNFSKANLLLKS